MTKEQLTELFAKHGIKDPKGLIFEDFAATIIKTKNRSVTSRPANIIKDNVEYYFCRNSGHYFTLDNMVKDKSGKSKGYSAVGNSIYTAAQKAKKNLLTKIDEVKDQIIGLDINEKSYTKDKKELMTKLENYNKEVEDSKWADGLWMTETFKSSLKQERQDLFDSIAHTKEELEAK